MPYETSIDLQANSVNREDVNFLAPNNFRLVIDNTTYKNVQYYVQKISIPDISLPKATLAGPMRVVGGHGDKIDYAVLELTFLIDEDLDNYKEIHDWMLGQLINEDRINADNKMRDITLIINTSHNNQTKSITFNDAYPVSLSSLPFESDISDVEYMVASVSFEYSYYKFD